MGQPECRPRRTPPSAYRIPVEELPTGTFLCALTNENRLSEIEIIEEACASRGELVVSIRTFMFRY